jgi:hypothetical protein
MSDPKLPQEDGLFEAMVLSELEHMPIQIDIERAITRLRANGFSAEADVLLGRGDAAWVMLRALRDALRRMDPAWCELHQQSQLSDEEFDDVLGTLEDLLEGDL